MSKSRGNVINPDQYVSELGADSVRAYLMFLGPWEQGGEWTDTSIAGTSRWLSRVWNLVLEEYKPKSGIPSDNEAKKKLLRLTHQTIAKVTDDMERLRFNTMIAALMEFTNFLDDIKKEGNISESDWKETIKTLLLLLAPTAPHLAEELWQRIGYKYSIHNQKWPEWDEALACEEEITLVVQVNGKVRDRILVSAGVNEDEAKKVILGSEKVKAHLEGKKLVNTIYVPGKLVNLVVK